MGEGRIETEIHGQVGWLILANEARRNAMSFAMYQQVPEAVTSLLESSVRCIVVRGRGQVAFGAGSDIGEFLRRRMGETAWQYNAVEEAAGDAVRDAPVPVVAMIHGACRGGGLAMALNCDLRIAATGATFAAPPAKLGVGYPLDATAALARAVGDANARRLLLTGETLTSTAAASIGLVHEVVHGDDLGAHVADLTQRITDLAPLSLAAAKAGLAAANGTGSDAAASAAIMACYESADYREGIEAFLEKRAPRFSGN